MKKASEIYDPDDKWGWYDYQPMLEAFGEILLQVDCGEYQGDSYLIIKSDDKKYGYLNFGWGSCSGCDALQGCSDINEVQELMDQLYSQIRWFDSLKELKEYFSTKDWSLEYGWCYDDFKDFINKVINYEYLKNYKKILSSDLVWLYLGSLISADVIISKEKCIESLEKLNFIKDNIDKLELPEERRNRILDYSIKGIDIVNQDLKDYE